jgi:homoserine kinase
MIGSASAPGSSGNLGPGFDVLGLALELRCTVTAKTSDVLVLEEPHGAVEIEEGHILARAVTAAVDLPMRLWIDSPIPLARGLGSSSAVASAATAASIRAAGREPTHDEIYEIVAAIEGHGDNVAASVYGGLVAVGRDGPNSLEIHPSLIPVVAVPDFPLKTSAARSVLPEFVERGVASRTAARTVLLVEGLRTADPATLAAARGDEMHEEPRGPLSPLTGQLIEASLAAGALHAAWSGAGPSALAFATEDTRENVVAAMESVLGEEGRTMTPPIDFTGLR